MGVLPESLKIGYCKLIAFKMWKYISGQFLKVSMRKERKSPESCPKYEVLREDKDQGCGESMMRGKVWFASGVLRTNKHRMF